MAMPMWAQDLVIKVAIDEGRDDLPDVMWRRAGKLQYSQWRPFESTGVTHMYKNKITITAGTDRRDQKLVILHELAHWLMPKGENHGSLFWDKAWQLYRRYKVPIRYALLSEGNYRKGAIAAYRRSR